MPTSRSLYDNLPQHLIDADTEGYLAHIVSAIQVDLDIAYSRIEVEEHLYDPDLAPANFQDWLGQLVGLERVGTKYLGLGLNPDWSYDRKKKAIESAWVYWQILGTRLGINTAIEIWLGWEEVKVPGKLELIRPFGDRSTQHLPGWWNWATGYSHNHLRTYPYHKHLGAGANPGRTYAPLDTVANSSWQGENRLTGSGSGLAPDSLLMHARPKIEDWNLVFPDLVDLAPEMLAASIEPQAVGWLDFTGHPGNSIDATTSSNPSAGASEFDAYPILASAHRADNWTLVITTSDGVYSVRPVTIFTYKNDYRFFENRNVFWSTQFDRLYLEFIFKARTQSRQITKLEFKLAGNTVRSIVPTAPLTIDDRHYVGAKIDFGFILAVSAIDIIATPASFDENALNPTATLSVTGIVANGFALVSGSGSDDNGNFTIVGNTLRFNGTPNFEVKSSYRVRIGVAGVNGSFYQAPLTIAINDLNEPPTTLIAGGFPIVLPVGPTFGSSSYTTTAPGVVQDINGRISFSGGGFSGGSSASVYSTVAQFTDTVTGRAFNAILLLEGNPNPTIVTSLGNNDPDTVVNSTYSLISGAGDADNAVFSIVGNQLIINTTTDYEVRKEYSVLIRVTTDGGLFADLPLRVNIIQTPEHPNDIFLSGTTIGALNQSIGTLSTTDPDNFSVFTYSIQGGNLANYLGINGSQLILSVPLDGLQLGYDAIVRATDETGLFVEHPFSLSFNVDNVSYLPTASIVESISAPVFIKATVVYHPVNLPSGITPRPYPYFAIQN